MDRMLGLLEEHRPEFLFFQLILRQLPSQVLAVLASTTIIDCWDLAEEANTFWWVSNTVRPRFVPHQPFHHCLGTRCSGLDPKPSVSALCVVSVGREMLGPALSSGHELAGCCSFRTTSPVGISCVSCPHLAWTCPPMEAANGIPICT